MTAMHLRVVAAAVLMLAVLTWPGGPQARSPRSALAVFPVENLTGGPVGADQIRNALTERLIAAGVGVFPDEELNDVLTRHRIRYTAGVDAETAAALRREAGVDGVLIPSIDHSNAVAPPKLGLVLRLVSIEAAPTVVWADDVGMSGDDAPGFFGLGMVTDYGRLVTRALDGLTGSLLSYLTEGRRAGELRAGGKFNPKTFYRQLAVESGPPRSVAVLPFFNLSDRRGAGDILALLFVRHLSQYPGFRVVDTGLTRRQLLNARIIMDGGVSLRDAETVASLVDADYVLAGRVLRYEDYEGFDGTTSVEFSTVLIERSTRRVVWSSDSDNTGKDGVRIFGRGTFRSAHSMATRMASRITALLAGTSS